MTFIAVLLLGAGIVLIGSALDNTSVATTLQKLVNNQPLDWSGTGTQPPKSTATPGGGIA